MAAPPAITPNRAPGDMVTTSPTPGIFSEIAGFAPPRNGVAQAVQFISSIGTAVSHDGHGQLGVTRRGGARGAGAVAWTGTAASTGATGTGAGGAAGAADSRPGASRMGCGGSGE